ncbi:MAG TPA: AAA family ATPase [Candidatus Eisenbacteria bacterium]|nr:AAA family ATPase [Candidatus Eisenbacteria bacterium]
MHHTDEETIALVPELPQAPESLSEIRMCHATLEDLALKILLLTGSQSLKQLADKTRLSFGVASELLRRLRAGLLCEVTGMIGDFPQIAITSIGRSRALELLSVNQYAGVAPVSFESYVAQVRRQSVRDVEVHSDQVRRAFADLTLDSELLRKLGTALNSGAPIFLYGPSGTGKTTIATALSQAFMFDRIWIPHAVEADGQIICVYDPLVHGEIDGPVPEYSDPRWVLCRRPSVVVGGELTIEMLELQFNSVTKFYTAPVQMKANNGILIIDDFGRQRLRPEELLNRWIVPLDRRVDFLTLAGGMKLEIPFELFVVFATNLDPATLVDPAFLRRIQTKIKVDAVSDQQFHAIFRQVCNNFGLQCDPVVIDELINVIRRRVKEPLRACLPRDIVNQVRWAARYERKKPRLDRDALMTAVDAYFVPHSSEFEVEQIHVQ